MFFKILWQFVVLYMMVVHCCEPSTDGEALKKQWLELSASDCGHQSILMVPGFSDLSIHKGESIDRFMCNGTEAHCPPEDKQCAKCYRNMYDNVTQDLCTDSVPPDHQPIEVTSGCSWYYQYTMNEFRYPTILNEAFCNHCDYCRLYDSQSDFHCEGVFHKIPILLANNREEPGPCKYDLKYQDLRVGCTCARKPMNTPPEPIKQHREEEIIKPSSKPGYRKQGKIHPSLHQTVGDKRRKGKPKI